MEDTGTPNPLSRRKSIAGPFMRSSTGIPAPSERRGSTTASSSAKSTPAPLTRANTVSGGGWFGGWFSRSRVSISQSTGIPKSSMTDADLDNHAHLASSAPGGVSPPKSEQRDLMNSTGSMPKSGSGPGAQSTAGNMPPPLTRRLSEVAIKKPMVTSGTIFVATSGNGDSEQGASPPAAAAAPAAAASKKPSLLEADLRQGPIENDLFWTVLREIGE